MKKAKNFWHNCHSDFGLTGLSWSNEFTCLVCTPLLFTSLIFQFIHVRTLTSSRTPQPILIIALLKLPAVLKVSRRALVVKWHLPIKMQNTGVKEVKLNYCTLQNSRHSKSTISFLCSNTQRRMSQRDSILMMETEEEWKIMQSYLLFVKNYCNLMFFLCYCTEIKTF